MIFLLLVGFVVARFGRAGFTRSDFYTGDRTFTAPQSGLAQCGAFLMTASLALSGDIALQGYDGVLLTAGFAMSWLVALLLVAEPLRNTGRYSLGDVLSLRATRQRPVRLAAAAVTLLILICFMIVQLVAAGSLVAPLLQLRGPVNQALLIVTIGSLAAVIVHYGGMRGAAWTQMMKAGLLLAALVTLAGVLLAHYRFDVPAVLRDAAANAGPGERLLAPGARFGDGPHRLEFVSQLLTVVLGNAALPYLCVHFLAVPNARHARRAVSWAIWLTTPYYLLIILIGFGAAAQIGPQRIASAPGGQLAAVRLLALELGGLPLLTFVASAVITTTVAVTAGLVITAAASFARDIYPTVIRTGPVPDERREITVARHAVVVLCVLVTGCAILLMNQNVEFLLSLGLTLAASSILPALLFSWFWRGFTTAGALWSMYAGAAVTVVLTVFSSAVSGDPLALFPGADFAYFPWRHVGLVSIPLAFVLGYVGAKVSAGTGEDARYAEMEVRALTGAGAAEAATGAAAESLPRDPDPGRDSRPRSSA